MAMIEKGYNISPQQCEEKFGEIKKKDKQVIGILGRPTSYNITAEMDPTPTETEKVEAKLPTSRVGKEIQGPDGNNIYISSFSSTRKLSGQDFVDGSRSVNPKPFREKPLSIQRVIHFVDGSRSVDPEVFLEMLPPSLQD
ncbi:hypothetical protein OSB04_017458, partial [Centaurea solstitialis]